MVQEGVIGIETLDKEAIDKIYYNKDYQILTDENGRQYVRYYDDEFKFWVNIYYDTTNGDGLEEMKNTLKKIALNEY